MERLGEVPVAVVEKAKTCGGHNLSGAVMNPGPLQELFPEMTREQWREEGFAFGEVKKEAMYVMPNSKTKIRCACPRRPINNHGNEVVSVSALARYQQRRPRRPAPTSSPRPRPRCLMVEDGRRRRRALRRQGPRQGGRGAVGNFEPGTDIKAHATVLAEGCWGHLTGAAIKEFDLAEGREPQVWELGVKEVWKVKRPLDRLIHTLAAMAAEDLAPSTGRSAAPGSIR